MSLLLLPCIHYLPAYLAGSLSRVEMSGRASLCGCNGMVESCALRLFEVKEKEYGG